MAKAGVILGAVILLSWLGARSAQSTPPPEGQVDPELAALAIGSASGIDKEQAPTAVSTDSPDSPADAGPEKKPPVGVLPDGRIVLNDATVEELCKLPTIGPSRAAKIIELRTRLGGFRSLRQLLRVKGIGPRTLKRLTPLMVLDAPAQGSTDGG
jgi:competence protein ComEA